jgi:signal transduction histidine kinase
LRQRYLVSVIGCAILGLLSAAETYFWGKISGTDLSFAHAFVLQGTVWCVFAGLAPSVAAWGVRFRLEWPPRPLAIAAHLVAAAGTLLLFAFVGSVTNHLFGVSKAPDPFWVHFAHSCVYQAPFALITYGATVGAGYAAEATRRSRELARLQAELTQAQLSALRMQLNPHFLFNTLHTIAAFVREHDERQAVELIERLGDVLRHVLRSSNELEAPLASEIGFLQQYLEIEQARFGDRLEIAFAIDDATHAALVPQLIVQPLVENALRHGLAPRAAPGRLAIAAHRRDGVLEVRVTDDGLGLRDGWDSDEGLGLPNVRTRLARMYGPAGRLELGTPPGGGVVATITLPFREAPETCEASRG